jgi:hypothetical protein
VSWAAFLEKPEQLFIHVIYKRYELRFRLAASRFVG